MSTEAEQDVAVSTKPRHEIARNDFFRSLALPEGIETTKINASLKNGVLEVVLPKKASVQRRSVEVK